MTRPDPREKREKTGKSNGAMSILEHLDELRSRLLRSVIVFAATRGDATARGYKEGYLVVGRTSLSALVWADTEVCPYLRRT